MGVVDATPFYSVGTKFANNPLIHSFKEFVLFNGVTSLVGWWLKDYDIKTNFVEIGEFPPNLVSGADGSCWGIRGSLTIPANMSQLGGAATFGNRAPNQGVTELIIKRSTPPTVRSFGQAPFSKIYVPDDAVETYKTTSPWSTYASRIYPMSEYPVS